MKRAREDLSGQVFSRLTVLEFVGFNRYRSVWKCVCSCGTEKTIIGAALTSGATKSCGCLSAETLGNRNRTHGLSLTTEYKVWAGMHRRCAVPSCKGYHRYGGRGITVCERWNDFETFLADMGNRPSKEHSLDRKNNNGNYEPGNCRWATRKEQHENTSIVKPIAGFPSITAAGKQLGIPFTTLVGRLKRGWSVERVLTPPKFHRSKRNPTTP